jgi:cytidine deaminase
VYTSKGEVVTFAANTTFFGNNKKFTIHAEEFAILKLNRLNPFRFKKLNLLVVRYRRVDRKLSIAKPCVKCQALLSLIDINVYYTNRDGSISEL